jgi:hypothetical protein
MAQNRAINVAIGTLASAGLTTLLGFNEVGRAVLAGEIRILYCLLVALFIFFCLWLLEIGRPKLFMNYVVGSACGIAIGLLSGALATLVLAYMKLGSWRFISSSSNRLENLIPFFFGSLVTGSWLQGLLATLLLCRAKRAGNSPVVSTNFS